MARLNPTTNSVIREYVEATAFGIALAICMPILGVAALLLRGVAVGVLALALFVIAAAGLWRWAEPRLSPGCRVVVRELAVGAAILAGIPILALGVVVVGGAMYTLLPVAAITLAVAGIWRIIAAGRHMFNNR